MPRSLLLLLAFTLAIPSPAKPLGRCAQLSAALIGVTLAAGVGISVRALVRHSRRQAQDPEFGEEEGLCCVCRHMPRDPCTSLGRKECENKVIGTTKDCTWTGSCRSRFEIGCEKWLEAPEQEGCVAKVVQREDAPLKIKEAFEGKACQKVRYRYDGHGRGKEALMQSVSDVLLTSPKGIANFEFDDDGCSTFGDLDNAEQYLQLYSVGAHRWLAGKNVKISANQCLSIPVRGLQTRYLFEIDASGGDAAALAGRARPCESRCHKEQKGETVRCLDGKDLVSRTCHCDPTWPGTDCHWE